MTDLKGILLGGLAWLYILVATGLIGLLFDFPLRRLRRRVAVLERRLTAAEKDHEALMLVLSADDDDDAPDPRTIS